MGVIDPIKASMEDVRGLDLPALTEAEGDIRKEMAKIRLDLYAASGSQTAKTRTMRKTLARIMTVKTELLKQKPKAAAKAKAPAKAKAKAPVKAPAKASTKAKTNTKTKTTAK
ncbi:MAG: 50S ribosomal protein L29 [Oligoflexales bacterium]